MTSRSTASPENRFNRVSLRAGTGLLAAALATAAHAQAAQLAAAPAPQAAADTGSTQEIVVTAQKRSEKLQNVPISISAVTGQMLAKSGITAVAQLQQAVPALRLNYSGNTVQPSIRGIGSSVAGPGLYSNIPIYVDGYYISSPTSSDIDLIDVENVSVLKGPQGTLFGRNATGGAIQITTKTPSHETQGLIKLSYESFDHSTAAFYGTTGITSTIAVSLSASYEHGNGYITNITDGDDHFGAFRKWSVRPKVLWTPTDNLSFTLAYAHTYADDPLLNAVNARVGPDGRPITTGNVIPGLVIATRPNEVSVNGPSFNTVKTNSVTLTSALKMDWADLTSYTGYRKDSVNQALDYDATPAAIDDSAWTIPDKQFTQEINLTSKPGGRLSWVLGAFYYWATDTYDYNLSLGGAPYVNAFVSKNTTRSYAGFADATYEVLDNLFVTGGLRYSKDDLKLAYPAGPLAGLSGKASFHNFSPRGVIRYQLTPQSNVYASYTKGYKSGALPGSAFDPTFTPVKPEKIDAYEVGYKIANRRLRFNIAGFYYNYKDVQVASYGSNGTSITQNAASEHIYGVDGELAYAVTPDFNINLSGAWTHAKYNSFDNAIGYQQDPTTGAIGVVNIPASGFPVLQTPRFSGTIGADYGFDLADGRLVVNGSYFYSSHFYFDAVKQLPQKAYGVLNLRATWTDPSKKLDLSVYATNVTDKNYRLANFTDPLASRQVWAEPRSVGGSITYHY
ncbi:TonB-dependent receptor [Sphingomonas sp. CGMCC 1.13654]|uniref:TonB-dependent receptor n=1 Tax=Sphingomonas chungangi TaxID=2683589 RepID=A0A838L3X5_9SPHN|nr:TonB-dependent receptor [Sphingomonas chungangi]MBA2933747.1 TonB-dependent receptor [Sphingomonas chungangi]MVW55078.1 TonB-dependent receptor [Sphingomonas chungangi]